MQRRSDYAIQKHCNLAHMYQPMCQHWLTTHNVTCSLENLCCPTIAQCRFVGESQFIPIINLSTAQQVYCHAVGRCTPECCETGDAQGCKPIMLCNVKTPTICYRKNVLSKSVPPNPPPNPWKPRMSSCHASHGRNDRKFMSDFQ